MEIERKFLPASLPENLGEYPKHCIEQAYLCTNPVVRVRRSDEEYYLTYKGSGLMAREEYNLPLTREAYEHLRGKADGLTISKTRYFIPLNPPSAASFKNAALTAEVDVFADALAPLVLIEVEFASLEEANVFLPPDWFGREVTNDGRYHNSYLSKNGLP